MKKSDDPGWMQRAVKAIFPWTLTQRPSLPAGAGDGFGWNADNPLISRSIGERAVMQLSAAKACVSLLSDTLATLPGNMFDRSGNGRKLANDHPLALVFRSQPSPDVTPVRFLGAFIASMLLRDGGYAEKLMLSGRLVGLRFLPRDRLIISLSQGGQREFWFTERGGNRRQIAEAMIWFVPGFSLDGECGCSAIEYGCGVFGSALAADTAARNTFWRGLLPSVYFKYPRILKEGQREEAREMIGKISGAVNAGKPVILEADMEAGAIGINPRDAQLLESRAFSVEEICSWFRVQPFMIGRASQGQTNWGTGIEQQMIGFVTFTLRPWIVRLEQSINALLPPADRARYFWKFSVEGLLRGDSAARKEFYASALQNGWMSINEVRALEDLEPIEGGDVHMVQSSLIPLDQLGAMLSNNANAAKLALLSWLKPDGVNEP